MKHSFEFKISHLQTLANQIKYDDDDSYYQYDDYYNELKQEFIKELARFMLRLYQKAELRYGVDSVRNAIPHEFYLFMLRSSLKGIVSCDYFINFCRAFAKHLDEMHI